MLGLIILGLLHGHLLWYGDILVAYGCCGLWIYFFRKKSPKSLLMTGLIILSVSSLISIFSGWSVNQWPADHYQKQLLDWQPTAAMISEEIATYRGSWSQQMAYRVPAALYTETFLFLVWALWRAGGLMLIGMALYKWGVLTTERSSIFYKKEMIIGFPIGFLLVTLGIMANMKTDWQYDYSMFHGSQFNYWGSLFVDMGYIGMIMLMCQSKRYHTIKSRLSSVGRMALTNYLLQTMICTTVFYGHGLGLFGQVSRIGQIAIVFAVWICQLFISPFWLRYFHYGPFEWMWRSFSYLQIQPMRV
jgi:uncharacterized protein